MTLPLPPTVHVVCCFLNAAQFLEEAVQSVRRQTLEDWCLVLVDDGSSDGSTEIAKRLANLDPRIKYVEHSDHRNLGLSASRNAGIGLCRSPFVAFIDADDAWVATKLSDQVAIMARYPNLGMVCGAAMYWGSWQGKKDWVVQSGHRQDVVLLPPESILEVYPLGQAHAPPPSDLLVRSSILGQTGLFEAEFTGPRAFYEDQAFLCKLYLNTPVFFSTSTWLHYRQHETSLMAGMRHSGAYDYGRKYFLNWLRHYLDQLDTVDPKVTRATSRALLPYQIPFYLPLRRSRVLQRIAKRVRSATTGAIARFS